MKHRVTPRTIIAFVTLFLVISYISAFAEDKEQHSPQAAAAQAQKQQLPANTNPAPDTPPQQPQQPKTSLTWSISSPPERLRIPANKGTQFTVSAGEKAVKGLKLVQSTLQDTSSLVELDTSQMSLCADDAAKKCESTIDIDANSIRPITLNIDPSFECPGVFTGEVRFSVKDQSETKSFKLTVYSRPLPRVALGGLAIVVGLLIYFITHIWLRVRLARDQALVPVYELRETLVTLREKIATVASQTGYVFGGFAQAFSSLESQLSDAQIRAYLPPALPTPGSPTDDWVSGFKSYLSPLRDKVAGLVVLTNSGALQAALYWSANQAATKTALQAIDGLTGTVANADGAQVKVAPIIQTLVSAINQPAAQALAPFLAASPVGLTRFFAEPPDEQSVRVDLYRSTIWLWGLWIVIAFLGGVYVVILSNLGFGTYTDIIKCFFWGLGLSVAGGQLEQMTLSTVTSSFGVSVPKG